MTHKLKSRLLSMALTAAMVATTPLAMLKVAAEEKPKYISEVFIAYGRTEEDAIKWLNDHGWEPVGKDGKRLILTMVSHCIKHDGIGTGDFLFHEDEYCPSHGALGVEKPQLIRQRNQVAALLIKTGIKSDEIPEPVFVLIGLLGLIRHHAALFLERNKLATLFLRPTVHLKT